MTTTTTTRPGWRSGAWLRCEAQGVDNPTNPLNQDALERARREAARLLSALGDLDTARHYGLTAQGLDHLNRAAGIVLGLQVDLAMLRRELDPDAPEPEPAPEPGSVLLDWDKECPDCGHSGWMHDTPAYRARRAETDWVGCAERTDPYDRLCGCQQLTADRDEPDAPEPGSVLLDWDEECPDCGHSGWLHDTPAYRARRAETDWVGCTVVAPLDTARCGCKRLAADPVEPDAPEPEPPGDDRCGDPTCGLAHDDAGRHA